MLNGLRGTNQQGHVIQILQQVYRVSSDTNPISSLYHLNPYGDVVYLIALVDSKSIALIHHINHSFPYPSESMMKFE